MQECGERYGEGDANRTKGDAGKNESAGAADTEMRQIICKNQ